MAKDPLQTVLRLRRMEVDAARAALVHCEGLADEAITAERGAEAAIQAEMAVALRLGDDDAGVEAFSAWLPAGRAAVATAAARRERAQEEVGVARARLNLARAAAEAVEKLIEEHASAAAREALRKEQIVLDEMVTRKPRP